MRPFLIAAAVVGFVASAASLGFGQAKPTVAPSIEGAWKSTTVVTTGATAGTVTRGPSVSIYAHGYYSDVFIADTTPRKPVPGVKVAGQMTDAEKLARYEEWAPLTAQSGTYQLKGNTLIRRVIVAKVGANMTGVDQPPIQVTLADNGKTLVLSGKTVDGKSDFRRTFTRLP